MLRVVAVALTLTLAAALAAASPAAAAKPVPPWSPVVLTVSLPSPVYAGVGLVATARLFRRATPTTVNPNPARVPLVGQAVTFAQSGVRYFVAPRAVTDATGTARITLVAPRPGPVAVTAYFAGSAKAGLAPARASASAQAMRVSATRTSVLIVAMPALVGVGYPTPVTVTLFTTLPATKANPHPARVPLAGQVVTFTQSGVALIAPRAVVALSAVTDVTGTARIMLVWPGPGSVAVTAYFAGSAKAGLAPARASASARAMLVAVCPPAPVV